MHASSPPSFFQRYAIVILMAAFFLLPFGLRGARMAVRGMRNDVKDWLPSDFDETQELKWFRDHFSSEAFIVATWEGCRGTLDDQHFGLFLDKFFRETPPSERGGAGATADSGEAGFAAADGTEAAEDAVAQADHSDRDVRVNEELGLYVRQMAPHEVTIDTEFPGNKFGLHVGEEYFQNWGGGEEKWLRGNGNQWFYVVPNGDIYRWQGMDTWVGRAGRMIQRWVTGENGLVGERVHTADTLDGPWYYKDPRRLEADLFKTVITGPSVVHMLTREGGALEGNPEAAVDRLRGTLFGPEGDRTCILLTLTDHAREHLHEVVGRGMLGRPRGKLLRMAEEAGLEPAPKPSLWPPPFNQWLGKPEVGDGPVLRLGGPPVDNVAIDEEGQVTLVRLVGLSMGLGLLIAWFSFRSIPVTLLLFFVGVSSAIASLGFVWWGGSSMDAVLMSMPSLVYVLGLSGAVHIVNYYRDTVATDGFPGNPTNALRLGWKPCTLAAFTTALGLVSLSNADIVPIRKFGIFSAIAVVFTLALMFSVMPAGLQLWPPENFAQKRRSEKSTRWNLAELVQNFWFAVGDFVVKRHVLVSLVCLGILVLGFFGMRRLQTTVQLLKLFHPEAKIIRDYTWLEAHLGKLVPMELVAVVDPSMIRQGELQDEDERPATPDPEDRFRLTFLDRMEITEHIRDALDERFAGDPRDVVGSSMMAATFVPPLPEAGGSTLQASVRSAYSRQLATYRGEITQSDYFRVNADDQSELWRVSLRLAAMTDVDYGEFVNDIKTAVEPVMSAYKYRNLVLRTLDRQREGRGFRGARVLILGGYRPSLDAEAASPPGSDDGAPPPGGDSGSAGNMLDDVSPEQRQVSYEQQWKVFSHAFGDLLTNAALRVRWHDPRTDLSQDWTENLAERFDCVIVVHDDQRYQAVEQVAGLSVIDARGFSYGGPRDITAAEDDQPVQVIYTGLVPVVYKAQRTLLNNLVKSTVWAFVAISVVMVVLLRSPRAGMVSMFPNVFPLFLVFGSMGWLDVLVDIGSMMTASVAMGVAVDDTIHFLTWFRRGLDHGLDRKQSIMQAYERCATAMTQTTLIAGLGLSVFALSTFTPTMRFGVLMLTLMAAALLGDLVFLPAILAGPAGRVFSRGEADASAESSVVSEVLGQSPPRRHVAPPDGNSQDGNSQDGNPKDGAAAREAGRTRRDSSHR